MNDREPGGSSAQAKTKVFISYSRRDMAWADWIVDALQKSGVEALIDREDIAKGEDFQERIFSLINQADTVVYLITPNSVSSKFCNIEVDYAESLNKRFVPLLLQPVSDAQGRPLVDAKAQPLLMPDALARINWVPFNEGTDANVSMGDLLNTLFTDLKWVREHTRLGEHALRWHKSGAPASQLLRGNDLDAAEHWRDTHPKNARPPTELQLQFIAASRKGAGKRRNMLVGSLVAGLVVAVGLGGLAYWQRGVAFENEKKAKTQLGRALRSETEFLTERAGRLFADREYVQAILLSLEGLPDKDSLDQVQRTRPFLNAARLLLHQVFDANRTRHVFGGHNADVTTIAFSPNGKFLVSGSKDKTVRIWNVETYASVAILTGLKSKIEKVAYHPREELILIQNSGKNVHLWSGRVGDKLKTFSHKTKVHESAFIDDGRKIYTRENSGTVNLWNTRNGQLIYQFLTDGYRDAAVSHDGKTIALVKEGTSIISIWDMVHKKKIHEWEEPNIIKKISFTPTAKSLLVVTRGDLTKIQKIPSEGPAKIDGSAYIRDILTGRLRVQLKSFSALPRLIVVNEVVFSHDKRSVLIVHSDFEADQRSSSSGIWDLESGSRIVNDDGFHLPSEPSFPFSMNEGAQPALIRFGIKFFDLVSGKAEKFSRKNASIKNLELAFSPDPIVSYDGSYSASIYGGGILLIENQPAGTPDIAPDQDVYGRDPDDPVSFPSPDGSLVATFGNYENIEIVSSQSGNIIHRIEEGGGIAHFSFSNSGKQAMTISGNEDEAGEEENVTTISVWDVATWQPQWTAELKTNAYTGSFSTDDKFIIVNKRKFRNFRSPQEFIDFAKNNTPRCFLKSELEQFGRSLIPPRWCITGPGNETKPREKWVGKYPYHTKEWQDWLVASDAGTTIAMPHKKKEEEFAINGARAKGADSN